MISILDLKTIVRGNGRERHKVLEHLLSIEGNTREGIAQALSMLPDLIRLCYRNSRNSRELLRELAAYSPERILSVQQWILRAGVEDLLSAQENPRSTQQTLFSTQAGYHELGY